MIHGGAHIVPSPASAGVASLETRDRFRRFRCRLSPSGTAENVTSAVGCRIGRYVVLNCRTTIGCNGQRLLSGAQVDGAPTSVRMRRLRSARATETLVVPLRRCAAGAALVCACKPAARAGGAPLAAAAMPPMAPLDIPGVSTNARSSAPSCRRVPSPSQRLAPHWCSFKPLS